MDKAILRRRSAGKLLRGEEKRRIPDGQLLAQAMHERNADVGRDTRADEHALIAAGGRKGGGERSIAAKAVGQKKAVFLRALKAAQVLFAEDEFHIIFPESGRTWL